MDYERGNERAFKGYRNGKIKSELDKIGKKQYGKI